MSMKCIGLALLSVWLALPAQAQQKCAFLPVCFPPYSPPIEGLNLYVGGVKDYTISKPCNPGFPKCAPFPMWYATGGVTTAFMACTDKLDAALEISVTRGGIESARSTVRQLSGTNQADACAGTVLSAPLTMRQIKSSSQHLAEVAASCLGDPACSAMVMNRCFNDAACKPALANLLKVDVNHDGRLDLGDAEWWQGILDGRWK